MTAPTRKPRLDHAHALELLSSMMRIRQFEDKCAEMYTRQKIRGFLHLYDGEEAVAVGTIPVLEPHDRLVATYREHAHALVRGLTMQSVMAEMYGKAEGCAGGRGGSMHLFSAEHNFYGGNAIVGGGLPLAVGLALADRMRSEKRVTACFFGEGAVAEGEFHESMNLAALWQLPVLFICENNGYAMGTALDRSEARTDIASRAATYGMQSHVVDGMDVVSVEVAARDALSQIREGGGPCFLECRTYRFRPHSMFDAQLYRQKEEVAAWREHGPILRFQSWLEETGMLHADELQRIEATIQREIDEAVEFAESGTLEALDHLTRYVTAEQSTPPAVASATGDESAGTPSEISYREAVRSAIRDAMIQDERVFLMGEDVGAYGGCYAVSKGLMDEFGPERIRDTPLSESGFTGAGIGAAIAGMRPIVEVMTVNFSLLALDQILNTAATLRHMSNNQFGVPVVIRMATGAGKQLAAQHSHSLEGWYAHIPGLRILTPATIEDARGMLLAALQDPDPVLIFENVMLYNSTGTLPSNAGAVNIEAAAIRRDGEDVSLITYGGSLHKVMQAAETLAGEGIDAEVIDLRSLRPLDMDTVKASVARTHRAVLVDEGWRSGSLAAEIGMRLAEDSFFELDAPLVRVCSEEVPVPYAQHLEEAAIPQVAGIVAAVHKLFGKDGAPAHG
ncbi:MAG: pyruvate dehydrogenase (acetyl-transferring) E1 component subunit alpha [Granulosicoccus sp.]|nr:pyruvate dehydrogenase (acetyl-transferring) E1 component subunit alpha [Granulosicoccus sp.]